jgi:E3 ubiquitin-protein ligase DOA10
MDLQQPPAAIIDQIEEDIIQQPMIIERPVRPVRNNNQRFDSLFDIHWEDNEDNGPPSPVAEVHNPMEESSNSVFHQTDKQTRASSMPPTLSRSSSSFLVDQDEDLTIGNDYNRRSASMEPSIDTSMTERFLNEGSSSNSINRGHPPHAPRMRHAEAPLHIRPIQEEEEEEEEEEVIRQEQIENNEMDQEEDENIEEFEGVLEAIGMNGSIWSLLQNSALMGLLIALSLGAAVWMPYLIGMLFIMTETLDLIRIPLKLTRLITDPLIDFLFMVCSDYIWPFIVDTYTEHIQPIIQSTTLFDKIYVSFMYIFNHVKDNGLLFSDSSHTTLADTLQSTNNDTLIDSGIQYVTKLFNETEPLLEHAFQRYQSLATGQTAIDRFACIAMGYTIVILVSCWYLARATHNNLATAAFGRTAQEAIRHQGIIFKVGMFIAIELVLFPIVCGFLLDASTMPLFKQATLSGRLGYLQSHPVPSIFLHWFLGTGFMFLFAVLVTICRDILRPGVMWFIRDPNDPQFHPIREIVERPVLFQFKKIGASALIYMTVILVGVGGVVHCTNAIASNILPLRWSLS